MNKLIFQLLLLVLLLPTAIMSQNNILVIDYNNAFSSDQWNNSSNIYNRLVATQTSVTRVASIPAVINPATYNQVWIFGNMGTPVAANLNPVVTYMNAGGAVYVQSEVSCCNNQAAYLDALINATVTAGGSITHNATLGGYYEANYTYNSVQYATHGAACRPFPGTPAVNQLLVANGNCSSTLKGMIAGVAFRDCDMITGKGALVGIGDFNVFPSAGSCSSTGILGTPNHNTLIDYLASLLPTLKCSSCNPPPITVRDTVICNGPISYKSPITNPAYRYLWSNGDTLDSTSFSTPGKHWLQVQVSPGCFTTDTFTITFASSVPVSATSSICQGDSIFLGGAFQKVAGNYMDTITSASSCDTIITTTLVVNPVKSTASSVTICIGDSILIAGQYRSSSGAFPDTLQTSLGCDSIHTVNLTIHAPVQGTDQQDICMGDSTLIGGKYRKTAGTYQDTVKTPMGCDSVINITVAVNPVYSDSATLFICYGDSMLIGTTWRKSTGYYTGNYSTKKGCDSTEVIHLYVLQPQRIQVADSVCDGDSLLFGGNYLSTGGTYIDTLQSMYGCDSIVTLTFSIRKRIPISAYGDTLLKIGQSTTIGVNGGTGSYTWTPPTGLSCTNCQTPVANPTETTWYFVSSGSGGCMATDSVLVEIDASFFVHVPNVFTPNGDGKNDIFRITAEGVESYNLSVFNRWGILLFERNSGPIEWDGKIAKSGKLASDGTYFFLLDVVKYSGDTESRKGSVFLTR